MDTRTDEDKFLMGGDKIPSASFLRKGDSHEGTILELKMRQQTDAKTREPKTFKDGSPMMALVAVLQTEEIDDEIEDDDGRRQVWIKFKMRDAVRDACKEAEVDGLRVGGYLVLTLTKQDKPAKVGLSGIKHYEATYTPPNEDAEADAYLSGDDEETGDETPPPAKKAAAKAAPKAPPKPPAAEPEHDGEWVEDDYHWEGDDGSRMIWDADANDWRDYIAPPVAKKAPAKKAPAKKAPPRRPSNDEDSF